jgi:hypothetical protein
VYKPIAFTQELVQTALKFWGDKARLGKPSDGNAKSFVLRIFYQGVASSQTHSLLSLRYQSEMASSYRLEFLK